MKIQAGSGINGVDTAETNSQTIAEVLNPGGSSAVVLVCEHASNFIPEQFNLLGISEDVRKSHVAWDPGADEIAVSMSRALDAVLVRSRVSRLVYDCNRPPDAPDAMPERSEIFEIPGNRELSELQRAARTREFYNPFRSLLDETLRSHSKAPVLVTIHTFTPTYFGKARQVEIGILHDQDSRLADAVLELASGYDIRRNEPYGPKDGVTHTLREHGMQNGLLNLMIEVRNDLVQTPEQCEDIASRLAGWIGDALELIGHGAPKGARA